MTVLSQCVSGCGIWRLRSTKRLVQVYIAKQNWNRYSLKFLLFFRCHRWMFIFLNPNHYMQVELKTLKNNTCKFSLCTLAMQNTLWFYNIWEVFDVVVLILCITFSKAWLQFYFCQFCNLFATNSLTCYSGVYQSLFQSQTWPW